MSRVQIPVQIIEFDEEGNTIWIQSPEGGTVIRIKCTGRIYTDQCRDSPISHVDLFVNGDIDFCISKDAVK